MANSTIPSTSSKTDSQTNRNHHLWQIDILPVDGQPNRIANEILSNALDLQLPSSLRVIAARGFLLQGSIAEPDAEKIAHDLLVEPVVETALLAAVGDSLLSQAPGDRMQLVYVLPLPGVTDPEAESARMAIRQLGYRRRGGSHVSQILGLRACG